MTVAWNVCTRSGLLDQYGGGATDVDRFVRSLLFNWVSGGTDAHAKNYGLLMHGQQARLTPLYDVASAVVLDFVERIGDVLAGAASVFADDAECRSFADRFRDAVAGHAASVGSRIDVVPSD